MVPGTACIVLLLLPPPWQSQMLASKGVGTKLPCPPAVVQMRSRTQAVKEPLCGTCHLA